MQTKYSGWCDDCIHLYACRRALKGFRIHLGEQLGKEKAKEIKYNIACGKGLCQAYEKKDTATLETERAHRQEEYSDYIKSDYFQNLKMQVFKRDGFQCQYKNCGSAKNILVHHTHYGARYNEDINDLVTVCQKCHNEIHANDKEKSEDFTTTDDTTEDNN